MLLHWIQHTVKIHNSYRQMNAAAAGLLISTEEEDITLM